MSKTETKQPPNIEIVVVGSVLNANIQNPRMEFECLGENLSLIIFDAEDVSSTLDARTALNKCIESIERNLSELKKRL